MINLMNRIRKNPYFWLVFTAMTAVVFLIAAKSFSNYTSKIDVLLLPKNEKTAANINLIKNNLVYLFNSQEVELKSGEEVKLVSDTENTIITFKSHSKSKESLGALNRKVVTEFFNVSSKHYNVKKDLEMKIIGNVSTKMYLGSFWLPLLIAVFLGGIISSLIFGISNLFGKFSEKFSSDLVGGEKRFSQINLDKFKTNIDGQKKSSKSRDEVESSLKASRRNGENTASSVEEIYKKHDKNEENIVTGFKKAYPPRNLPIVEEDEKKEKSVSEVKNESFEKAQDEKKEEGKIDWEARLAELKNKESHTSESIVKNEEIEKTESEKDSRGVAPMNLPIGDDGIFEITATSASSNDKDDVVKGEPTKEEYKERLNQLLRGDI